MMQCTWSREAQPAIRRAQTAPSHQTARLSLNYHHITCLLDPLPYPQATSDTKVILLTTIPWACAALTHLFNSMHSQHVGERRWHICVPWMAGSICLYCLAAAADAGKVGRCC